MSAERVAIGPCTLCDGYGCEEGCGLHGGCDMAYEGPHSHRVCRRCGGSGHAYAEATS